MTRRLQQQRQEQQTPRKESRENAKIVARTKRTRRRKSAANVSLVIVQKTADVATLAQEKGKRVQSRKNDASSGFALITVEADERGMIQRKVRFRGMRICRPTFQGSAMGPNVSEAPVTVRNIARINAG